MNYDNHVITAEVVSVSPYTSIEDAACLMRDHDIGVLPVVEGERLVGIVTDRDMVVRGIAERRDGWLSRVSDIMTSKVYSCEAENGAHVAAMLMATHQIRRVALVDREGRLCGLITLTDLIRNDCVGADFASYHVSARHRAGVCHPTAATLNVTEQGT
ncbi:CBS domain-containing protein [Croceibacterium sp. TMG7-5b_MA50]|uniref:CBS domain-containing protein n=1 Tax=Croceibacterium sp. TMG7-5b_MA50 TaxID=3121290 RepID=UPI0032221D17